MKDPELLDFRGEEFNPGTVTRLDYSEILCNKVFLKYKGDKVSDIDIRRGQKECPLLAFQSIQSLSHVQLCDPMDCRMPGFPVLHHIPEFAQAHVS